MDYDATISKGHSRYNESPHFRSMRTLVKARSNGRCVGCQINPAEHVHHLTYKNVFSERPNQLVGLCRVCHGIIESAFPASEFDSYMEDLEAHRLGLT